MERIDAITVDARSPKRAKRTTRVTAELPDSAAVEGGAAPSQPFRSTVRSFISQYARIPTPSQQILRHLRTWRIALPLDAVEEAMAAGKISKKEAAGDVLWIDVVEEDVEKSRKIYCDHCRIIGWSGHPVCTKRYHFIIKNERYRPHCNHCGALQESFELRCASCNKEATTAEFENMVYLQLEDPTHLLHGMAHANGYGHLLRINGREGGSKYLTGHELMEFWDRLCKLLCIRKASVMDLSKKHGMEYRLLHAVAFGHPWYGAWGYQFGTGSFGLNLEAYREAVDNISSIKLSHFQRSSSSRQLENIISFYSSLSNHKLGSVRDLFQTLMKFTREGCVDKELADDEQPDEYSFSEQDIRHAENAVIKILQAVKGSGWVTWRALRAASFQSVGSSELLEVCLKKIGGKCINGRSFVAARCNLEARSIEYRVEPVSNKLRYGKSCWRPQKDIVLNDLKFLYDTLLNPDTLKLYKPQPVWELAQKSAGSLLDCKQFIKHYDNYKDLVASNPFALHIWCEVELIDHTEDFSAPPPELLVLPIYATIEDLKIEATKAFQNTYLILRRFKAEDLVHHGDICDSTKVKLILSSGESCRVRGRCFGLEGIFEPYLMERGTEAWTVDCICGAKDDDGERMLACDKCGIWQHTRCSGIKDIDQVPAKFICRFCIGIPKHRGGGKRMYKCEASRGKYRSKEIPSTCRKEEKRCLIIQG